MAARIEWRSRGGNDDALLFVDGFGNDSDTVLRTWAASPDLLADFLNDMVGLNTAVVRPEVDADQRDPEQWGKLVLSRTQFDGDVLDIDPEIYWDRIYYWFRSRGRDPHPWGRR